MRVPSYNDHAINARRNKKSATNRQPDRHEVVHPCLRYDLLPMSPVRTGDCVVELVGLEPTTKVLWNMVGVRPAPLVGHLSRSPGVLTVLLDFPGFLILEPTNKVLWNMAGVRPTTWSDTHPDRRAFVVFRDYPG